MKRIDPRIRELLTSPGRWTLEDLAVECGLTVRTIYRHLKRLKEEGYHLVRDEAGKLTLTPIQEQGGTGMNLPSSEKTAERHLRQLAILQRVASGPQGLGADRREVIQHLKKQGFLFSHPTFARDLETLIEEGLLVSEGDHLRLGSRFLPPVNLERAEVQYLLAALAVARQTSPRPEVLARVQEKLLALTALPYGEVDRECHLRRQRALRERVLLKGKCITRDLETLLLVEQLEQAALEGYRLRLVYASHGATASRKVDPYGLVYYWVQDAWYLVGFCHQAGGIRTFRLDRIKELEPLEEIFVYPEDFSLAEYFRLAWGIAREEKIYDVEIRFYDEYNTLSRLRRETAHRETAQLVEETPRPGEGVRTVLFRDRVAGLDELRVWVRSFGSSAEVLAPPELRESLLASARRILARYRR